MDRRYWLALLDNLLVGVWSWFGEPAAHICIITPVYANDLCDFDCRCLARFRMHIFAFGVEFYAVAAARQNLEEGSMKKDDRVMILNAARVISLRKHLSGAITH